MIFILFYNKYMNEVKENIKLKVSSPSDEKRRLDLELKLKEERYENTYNTCCSSGGTDKRLIQYVTKFSLTILIMVFCFYQIITAGECDARLPWYCSLVSGVIGVWLNSPKLESQLQNINLWGAINTFLADFFIACDTL